MTPQTRLILDAILHHKQENDGISPTVGELAVQFKLSKSQVQEQINRLLVGRFLYKTAGNSRNLGVKGGAWQWTEPRPYPEKRVGDVLRVVVAYKQANDGNAPSHREIADTLGLSYTGDMKSYVDALAESGYIVAAYAADRHIMVVGGCWDYDEALLARANPDMYSQKRLI